MSVVINLLIEPTGAVTTGDASGASTASDDDSLASVAGSPRRRRHGRSGLVTERVPP